MFILDDQNETFNLFDHRISIPNNDNQYHHGYYAVYDEFGIEKAIILDFIEAWTEKATSERLAIAQSWSRGAFVDQPYGLALRALVATRQSRWQKLAQDLSLSEPTAFQLYRAIKATKRDMYGKRDEFLKIVREIKEVVHLWQSNPLQSILALQRNGLSSWSLKSSGTKHFQEKSVVGLLYKAIVSFQNTIADKWIDDSNFLRFPEYEVIVAGDVEVNVTDIEIILWERTYSIHNLSDLEREWAKTAQLGNLQDT